MAREIPEVVRAAAGLAATVLDEARKLPETLPSLPVRLIGLALQQAMKVQQQYAGFVARGDELFTGLRGENEPGLATFDDDEPAPAPAGFRDSAFDRAGDAEPTSASDDLIVDDELTDLPDDPAADAVTAAVDDLATQVEDGRQSIEELTEEAPAIEEILDEIAIDELVDDAPTLEETAPAPPKPGRAGKKAAKAAKSAKPAKATKPRKGAESAQPGEDAAVTEDAAAVETALLEAAATGVRTDVDRTDTSETDGAIAAGAAVDAVGEPSPAPTDEPSGGSDLAGSQAAGTAPIEGYDSFSIAQLRGRMRGYALSTVQDLLAYEEATRARAPYLTLLRNRLEKLEEQAVESSPLAPRGA
jgi:hypothetical protein